MVAIVELPSLVSETKILPNHLLDIELVTALYNVRADFPGLLSPGLNARPGVSSEARDERHCGLFC